MNEKYPVDLDYDENNNKLKSKMSFLESLKEAQVLNGTTDKPEHIEQLLDRAINVVSDYFKEYGFDIKLDNDFQDNTYIIDGNQVDLLHKDGQETKIDLYAASYFDINDHMYLKGGEDGIDRYNDVFIFRLMVHELVHRCQIMYLRAHESSGGNIHIQRRGGYQISTDVYKDNTLIERHTNKLSGLNEAVTELITLRAIERANLVDSRSLDLIWSDSYPVEKSIFSIILQKFDGREQTN